MNVQRISLVDVPVDICRPENLEEVILSLEKKSGTKRIVFLSIWDLLKARHNGEFRECIKSADLILPISKSIISGARFIKKSTPYRWNPFRAIIEILSILERHYKSIYLLGSRSRTLSTAEKNLRSTFPNLHIVGRCEGWYKKNYESDVVESIYKSGATLVLMSEGVNEKNLWSYRRADKFTESTFLYYRDAFPIFADRIKRVDEKTFDKGLEIFHELAHNPLKVFLIFPYLQYRLILLWRRFFPDL